MCNINFYNAPAPCLQVENKLRLAVRNLDVALNAVWALVEKLIFINRMTPAKVCFQSCRLV